MKLTSLKSALTSLKPTLQQMPANPMATKRQRGSGWMKRRDVVLAENPWCVMCQAKGIETLAQEVDHIVPLHTGGPDEDDNLQGLCIPCHKVKGKADGSHAFNSSSNKWRAR